MRKLNTADVFAFCRLIKATKAREQLRTIVTAVAQRKESGEEVDVMEVGVDGVLAVVEAAVDPHAEKMVYKFLSGPMECTPEAVAAMDLDTLITSLRQMAEQNNLTAFFGSASSILGKV